MAKKQKKEKLTIDYPKANEVIWGGHYAVRISVSQDEEVEAAIDGGKWDLCRHEAGHCWFDIHNLANGEHKLTVRMIKNGEGTVYSRKFIVSRE